MDVFGYASLADHGDGIAELSGYRRVWNVAMDNGLDLPGYKYYVDARTGERPTVCVAFLDLVPDPRSQVNGVVFAATAAQFEQLDRRERNYRREQVELAGAAGSAFAYLGSEDSRRRCATTLGQGRVVVDLNYYEAVREGFRRLGRSALDAFEASTDEPPCPILDLRRVEIPPATT
jgi:hypothetical protein